MIYQALLMIPALIHIYNRTVARTLLAVVNVILLLLNASNLLTFQPYQAAIVMVSLVLLIDPTSNIPLLSIVTLVSIIPLWHTLSLVILALLIFAALSIKRRQKNLGLYLLMVLPLTLVFEYLSYPFAAVALLLLLVGAPPFQKWLKDFYSNFQSTAVLVAFVTLMYLKAEQTSYAFVAPLLVLFGALMMVTGVFQCMICKDFTELYSTFHQLVFGMLLLSAPISGLEALFYYLLLPAALSLAIVHSVHSYFAEKTSRSGMFEFGALSNKLRVEAASTLMTYLILFTLISMSAEVFILTGVETNIGFIPIGCVTLFVAAASLAAFFRNYTLIYEGVSESDIWPSGALKPTLGALTAVNLLTALVPLSSLGILSFITRWKLPEFEVMNPLLMVTIAAILASVIIVRFVRRTKEKSWTTGYSPVQELRRSRGEIFTLWQEIFKPIYNIRVPDERISEIIGRISPLILLAIFILLVILGEIL